MAHTLLYVFTGTGNSLWTARELARHLGDTEILPMTVPAAGPIRPAQASCIGLVFPVHIWGRPRRVVRWIERLEVPADAYLVALAVNAGQVARTLLQTENLLGRRGLQLAMGVSVHLPSNYTPWGGPGDREAQEARFQEAAERLRAIAPLIRDGKRLPPEKGASWQNVLFSIIYRTTFKDIPGMDKKFWADPRCDGCGICGQICPADNIGLEKGRPVWRHDCEHCFACLHGCPRQAIQYGKGTRDIERYRNPKVSRADIARLWKSGEGEAARRPAGSPEARSGAERG